MRLHDDTPVLHQGRPLDEAELAVILVHGRGGTAPDILGLAETLSQSAFAYLAPQAANNSWYPNSFLAPIAHNEPYLSSALAKLDAVVSELASHDIGPEQLIIMGFSQGACLSLEYAARHAKRFGGVVAFSGGLIGTESEPWHYDGSLSETPIFIGCSDRDAHIPLERVKTSTRVLNDLGANVTETIYPGMGHTINQDELDQATRMMKEVLLANL
jgi:glyoxalase family protein